MLLRSGRHTVVLRTGTRRHAKERPIATAHQARTCHRQPRTAPQRGSSAPRGEKVVRRSTVAGLGHRIGGPGKPSVVEEVLPRGHLFRSADCQARSGLDRMDEVACVVQRIERARVEPPGAALEPAALKAALLPVVAVDIRDLALTTRSPRADGFGSRAISTTLSPGTSRARRSSRAAARASPRGSATAQGARTWRRARAGSPNGPRRT